MFGGIFFWVVLAVLVGVWASKLGRDGFLWGFIALLISPLIACICLLIMSNKSDIQKAIAVHPIDSQSSNDNEWEVVKKYIPEVPLALEYILNGIDYKGIASAEQKLKELFFVIGKEGLTESSLDIIIADVTAEVKLVEDEMKLVSEAKENIESKRDNKIINSELIEKLKGINSVGFNKNFSECEICYSGKTGQTISNHYVCSNCKPKYL